MSSSVTLTFTNEVLLDDWTNFCAEHKIDYSPDTIGQATFYKGEAEITVSPEGSLKRDEKRRPIWETARPPSSIVKAYVSTYFCDDLDLVGQLINEIALRFPCTASGSPELDHLILDVPQTYKIYASEGFISTDFVEAWRFSARSYSATVKAGDAHISQSGASWTVELAGVKRGTFVDLNQAFAFASRADWVWWYGERPSQKMDVKSLV